MRKEIEFTHQEKRKLLTAILTVTLSISALFIGRAVQKVTYNNHTYPLSTVIECVICSLIMHDNYTDIIYDDTIIKAQYSGFVR